MQVNVLIPEIILTGQGALASAGKILTQQGKKALIITDTMMVKLGNTALVTEILDKGGIPYMIYDQVNGEPTDQMVERGLALYQAHRCDYLIAIGGGSPIDTMKAIAALAGCGGQIADYMGKEIDGEIPPMIAIPTTAGTGSEATQFTIITDTQNDVKMLLKGKKLMPKVAVVDPMFSMTAPPSVTAATGVDALTHAIEAYTSRKAQPVSDQFALYAVKRIFQNLPQAYSDGNNIKAREEMAAAALEAGIAFNNSSVTIVHGMSRPIGALFHIAHGTSNAMLLKACLTFALDGAYERFGNLGRAIQVADASMSDAQAAEAFLQAVQQLCQQLNIPTPARAGIDRAVFESVMSKMADDALASGSPANTMKPVKKEDILEIYKALWEA